MAGRCTTFNGGAHRIDAATRAQLLRDRDLDLERGWTVADCGRARVPPRELEPVSKDRNSDE